MTSPRHRDGHLAAKLGDRDWMILESVSEYNYLTTRQLARLHFDHHAPATVIPRPANHALARLRALGLLANLERRIGGVRAGSGGHVWTLTELANRLLASRNDAPARPRVRTYEPSSSFLEHTLAVAEVVLTLRQISAQHDVALIRAESEPACWRPYLATGGAVVRLKPDLAVVTQTRDYEDHWFIEVDRATEPPSRIVRKSLQYQEYQRTGIEQRTHGVFPAVVWIVPSAARREQLIRRLFDEAAIDNRLFTVITLDQLDALITEGVKGSRSS
jgi:hypothetical protein